MTLLRFHGWQFGERQLTNLSASFTPVLFTSIAGVDGMRKS